ncbi:MAG: WYL domain-containing protein [Ruminococcus sp.]|nr:WYL domain-containing protein [Ruminococcus sp.]
MREALGTNTGLSRQKQKLLLMRSILLENTDENNPMTGNQLIEYLAINGIKEERKTLYDDIATLIGSGLAIEVTKVGHANAYYVSERLFEKEELFVLADAVASSKFLTQKRSNELIGKLQKLTSRHNASNLQRTIYVENRVKTVNEHIYYAISEINYAISNKKVVTFQYLRYDYNKKRQLAHNGELYRVSPYHLVWREDKYYLIGYNHAKEKVVFFRVDRMTGVTWIDEKRVEPTKEQQEFAKNLRSTFDMYAGSPETVTFEVDEALIDTMLDRFGMKILFNPVEGKEKRFTFKAEVQISPTFWGWLFSFGEGLKICSPANIVEQAKKEAKKLYDIYR